MPQKPCSLTCLRFALNHLYEPRRLQASLLLDALGFSARPDGVAALQRTLTQIIESLKSDADGDTHSPLWRAYEVLHYRYLQQCSQQEVADQIGVSVRQLRREQRKAIELLASRLCERLGLLIDLTDEPDEDEAAGWQDETLMISDDLRWLKELPPSRAAELDAVLPSVLSLVGPMAAQHGVSLSVDAIEGMPPLAIHTVALRQILLSLLGVAIRQTKGGELSLSALVSKGQVCLQMKGTPRRSVELTDEDAAALALAGHVTKASSGRLMSSCAGSFTAVLSVPAAAHVPVLVVDDNADLVSLFDRYVTGTRYRIVAEQNPDRAIATATEVSPKIIVLDVMMPEVDGWELLGRLRQHPVTSSIPIVVCTILVQGELARSLGVAAYLHKPVEREVFLRTLDRLISLIES